MVSTPNFTHIEVMRDIFDTDKHVLLEKPMCTNLADGLEVLKKQTSQRASLGWSRISVYVADPSYDASPGEVGEIKCCPSGSIDSHS